MPMLCPSSHSNTLKLSLPSSPNTQQSSPTILSMISAQACTRLTSPIPRLCSSSIHLTMDRIWRIQRIVPSRHTRGYFPGSKRPLRIERIPWYGPTPPNIQVARGGRRLEGREVCQHLNFSPPTVERHRGIFHSTGPLSVLRYSVLKTRDYCFTLD